MSEIESRGTLVNRAGAICMVWTILQQMVVATSTYILIAATRLASAERFDQAVVFLIAFAASLILVYVPNTISLVYLQKWRLDSFGRFVEEFVRRNKGKTTWAHNRDKANYESWLTNEALTVYDNATNLWYQVISIFLSSVLNVMVIAWVIDLGILAWYAAGAGVLSVSHRLFQGHLAAASVQVQSARNMLSRSLLTAWENVFTGNRYNLMNWRAQFAESMTRTRMSVVAYDLTRSLVSSVTVSLAVLFVAAGNGIFLLVNRDNGPQVAALIITFPRQLQIIQNIFAFFNIYLNWSGVREQLKQLDSVLGVSEVSRDPTAFVKVHQISLSQGDRVRKFQSIREFMKYIQSATPGRFTLRGRNGTGKSTLLSLLSEQTGEASFFLPSKFADLSFVNADALTDSDGNRLLAAVRELKELGEIRYILLDEWDANLDKENLHVIDLEISELARNHVVVESRHRMQNDSV
ncbi:MAG: hypothetical protein AB7G93_10455 [Bdellovibrionales bacterium]